MTNVARTDGLHVSSNIFDFYATYGAAANAYLTLYRDYQHFEYTEGSHRAMLAYVDTSTAWIGAADPVGAPEVWPKLIQAFTAAARAKKKEALILPVSKAVAEIMRAQGHFVVQIGSEPWIPLGSYRSRSDYFQMLPVARQLRDRGGVVDLIDPAHLSSDEHSELEALNAKWLESRKSVPLGFLNRLDTWALMKHKKYFRLKFEGQAFGYLAAVPIPARKAWYLVDLIRDPESPTGTTELLLIEAMDQLERLGAKEATLGMAPLVPADDVESQHNPKLYKTLKAVFNNGDSFYGFRSLQTYKEKFGPSHWEPLFLVGASPKLSWRAWYGLFHAIYPSGLVSTTIKTLIHSVRKIDVRAIVRSFMSPNVVTRPLPTGFVDAVSRLKASASLIAANILFYYLTVGENGQIRPGIRDHYVYSWEHMFHAHRFVDSLMVMVMPNVLHWNMFHLGFNLLMLVVAVGFTEMLAGSTLAITAYIAGSVFSNVLTSLALYPFFAIFRPAQLPTFLHEVDIGCSLGIFACFGAVAYLSRFPRFFVLLAIVASAFGTLVTGVTLELNHIMALIIGFAIAQKSLD